MENFQRLAAGLDVAPLLEALCRQSELWSQIVARQLTPGSPHRDTETIFLRWSEKLSVDTVFTDLKAVDYPAFDKLPEARALVTQVLNTIEADALARVILVKLKPGGVITPHSDEGPYADCYERFHLAVTGNPACWFSVALSAHAAEQVCMQPGELWWFNHKREHVYVNSGDTDRIHLIVDCIAPKYRRERDAA